jgi:succinate-acetate transporter protein
VGWRGAGGFASATNACSIWFGGLLLFFAGLGEFLLGNDFSFLVFMGYGAHILTFATTFVPSFNAVAFYSDGDPNKATAGFAASFGTRLNPLNPLSVLISATGYYPIALGILSLIFLLGALRTNLIFVLIFVSATTIWFCGSCIVLHRRRQSGHRGYMSRCNRCRVLCGGYLRLVSLPGHDHRYHGAPAPESTGLRSHERHQAEEENGVKSGTGECG